MRSTSGSHSDRLVHHRAGHRRPTTAGQDRPQDGKPADECRADCHHGPDRDRRRHEPLSGEEPYEQAAAGEATHGGGQSAMPRCGAESSPEDQSRRGGGGELQHHSQRERNLPGREFRESAAAGEENREQKATGCRGENRVAVRTEER